MTYSDKNPAWDNLQRQRYLDRYPAPGPRRPYAVFRFQGETLQLTEAQFKQAVADGRVCGCGKCLSCRALEYQTDAGAENPHVDFLARFHSDHAWIIRTFVYSGPGGVADLIARLRETEEETDHG